MNFALSRLPGNFTRRFAFGLQKNMLAEMIKTPGFLGRWFSAKFYEALNFWFFLFKQKERNKKWLEFQINLN